MARARARQRARNANRRASARLLTMMVCALAGGMIMVSGINARGTDLRPSRNTDLISLVQEQSRRNADLTQQITKLRREVDTLTTNQNSSFPDLTGDLRQSMSRAGMTAVKGPAVSVTLEDAPATVAAKGVDQDLLVVHQQDIQAVVNALWMGGAEAMTIQGQRVVSTTGIKCVGNTVVLHGIPYAPPYVIEAIGNQQQLIAALSTSSYIQIYQQYVDAYGLGYQQRQKTEVTLPGYRGSLNLQYAKAGR